MSHKNLYRVGLFSAIVSTLGWIGFIFGSVNSPDLSVAQNPEQVFRMLDDARFIYMLYGWGGVIGALLTIPYILAFFQATEKAGSVRMVAATFAVIGAVMTADGYLSNTISLIYHSLPVALESTTETMAVMETAYYVSSDLFEPIWFVGSFLVYGVAVFFIALDAYRYTATPKWLNVVGMISGVSGLIWLRAYVPFPGVLLIPSIMINVVGLSIWAIGLSAVLLRAEPNSK